MTLNGIPLTASRQRSRQTSVTPPGQPALPADSLVDSFGVRTDLSAPSTAYGTDAMVLEKIGLSAGDSGGLGVRHVRDTPNIGNLNARQMFPQIAALDVGGNGKVIHPRFSSNTGQIIGFGGKATVNSPPATLLTTILDDYEANFDPSWWDQLEGPNESNGKLGEKWVGAPNGAPDPTWDWAQETRNRISELYNLVKVTRAGIWGHVKLAGPSLVGAGKIPAQELGNIEAWIDRGNIHYYTRGLPPSGLGGIQTEVLAGKIKVNKDYMVPTKPLVTTESGMHDANDERDENGNPSLFYSTPSSNPNGQPTWPDIQKIYIPKLLMENIWAGQEILYYMELVDDVAESVPPVYQDHERHMGLYNHDWTPKSSAVSMKHLLDLFRDPGTTTFTPAPLYYEIVNGPSDMRQMLFQKRNGKWLLAVWREHSIWDRVTKTSIVVNPVTITINTLVNRTVNLYRPSLQAPVWQAKGSVPSFNIDLGTELVVCEIS